MPGQPGQPGLSRLSPAKKEPVGERVTVPVTVVPAEPFYLRQRAITISDGRSELGSVDTTTGLGGEVIVLSWGDRTARVMMSELLRNWVSTFNPESAKRIPGEEP